MSIRISTLYVKVIVLIIANEKNNKSIINNCYNKDDNNGYSYDRNVEN